MEQVSGDSNKPAAEHSIQLQLVIPGIRVICKRISHPKERCRYLHKSHHHWLLLFFFLHLQRKSYHEPVIPVGLLREHWMGNQFQTYHHSFRSLTCFCNSYFMQEVDLSIPFGDPRNSLYNTSRPSQGPKIYIDLTIEPYANMQK